MPELDKNQLIVLSDGWVICAYITAGALPYQFVANNASVICSTGGTPWDELADGLGRERAVFRVWGRCTFGPFTVLCREWKGELPKTHQSPTQ